MTVKVRFAPSPTGRLHIGNIRAAVINWLFARQVGGEFILRLDDTDVERSSEEFADSIRQDLSWLGLAWSRQVRQTDRLGLYDDAATRLRQSGRLYACYESADELERRRKRQLARGLPPVYDRAALRLTAADRQALEAEGRRPHWRFLLNNFSNDPSEIDPAKEVVWDDLVRGRQGITMSALSDPVLVRENGSYLYTFTSVVDDIEMAISHIVRGEDHVTNTAVQIQIFEALAAPPPAFAHMSLLLGADGGPLSKRLGGLAIGSFRDAGLEPMAVVSHAATLGTSDPVAAFQTLDELAGRFAFAKLGRAPARFDENELRQLNARLLHEMPFSTVAERLLASGVEGGEAFWLAVRGNLAVFADAQDWWQVVSGVIAPQIEDPSFAASAAKLLPAEPWNEATWSAWTNEVKARTGAKGKALFQPLRLALTGREHGPEMKLLLPLIGHERALARLTGQTA